MNDRVEQFNEYRQKTNEHRPDGRRDHRYPAHAKGAGIYRRSHRSLRVSRPGQQLAASVPASTRGRSRIEIVTHGGTTWDVLSNSAFNGIAASELAPQVEMADSAMTVVVRRCDPGRLI